MNKTGIFLGNSDYEEQLKKRLLDHYVSHRKFMNDDRYASFINRRLNNEDFQEPWINTLKLLIAGLKEKIILDVGCGDGGFTTAMVKRDYKVHGCDVSRDNIEMSGLRARKCGIDPDIFLESGTVSLPYDNDSFDVIVMFDVIEHLKNIPSMIREVHRVLKSGGYFFSSTPNGLWPMETHVNLPFVHWLPSSLRRSVLKKLRGDFAVGLIDNINYLSSRKLLDVAAPLFEQCLLNDDIFMEKMKGQALGGANNSTKLKIKRFVSGPAIWPFMGHVLKWAWPSIYLLTRK
jgi:2-polyprenyl-3-methyl-5-hydroxy-6-metoxy-1,4-benzoquinol methylase